MNASQKSKGLPKSMKWALGIATALTMIGAAASAVMVNSHTIVRAEDSTYEPNLPRRRVTSIRAKRVFRPLEKASAATSADDYLDRARRLSRDL